MPARDDQNSNLVNFTWDIIKLKDKNMTGGSTSLSGYVIQMAKDPGFTQKVRTAYVAKGKAKVYGLYDGYDWYFRIATRNEVSNHYKLPGGVWSDTYKLAASHGSTPTPASNIGVTGGTPTGGTGGGSTGSNNGGSTSGSTGGTPTPPTPGQQALADTTLQLELKTLQADLAKLVLLAEAAADSPTEANLQKVSAAAVVVQTDAITITAKDTHYNLTDAVAAWTLVANDADRITAYVETALISFAPADLAVVQGGVTNVQADVAKALKIQLASEDGTEQTGSVSGVNYNSQEGTLVFTPIPPTPEFHAPFGGLLVSNSPRVAQPEYSAYLMDRGGRTRLEAFGPITSLKYNRVRDAPSTATLTLSGANVVKSAAAIDRLDLEQGVNRYELCIYRGDERVWEGPVTMCTIGRNTVTIDAKDITHWLNRTVMHGAYSNAYPNIAYAVDRIAGIIASELSRKEELDPPVNILKWMHTYVEDGDAVTTRVTDPGAMTLYQHLDDLASKGGINYTVVGRALHIWDTSRAPFGQLRTVTEQDFIGDTHMTIYGTHQATIQFVTDGQGGYGVAGAIDPFYGEIELVATAYDENGNSVARDLKNPTTVHLATISQEQLDTQAEKNLVGRNPTPRALAVPTNSGFRLDRGIGFDVLIPGVYVPVSATLAGGRQMNQMLKLSEVVVDVTDKGENVAVTLDPAQSNDFDPNSTLEA
jgi:hypothetical protein